MRRAVAMTTLMEKKRTATQLDAELIVDAHVQDGSCATTDKLFKQFLVNILNSKPDELSTLADYQVPHGNVKTAKVFHVLHWPSKPPPGPNPSPLVPGPAKFRFDAYTLKVVLSMFPGAENEHYFHDFICKSMYINNPDGTRRSNAELYGDLPFEAFVQLTYDLICEADEAEAFVIHGGPVRRAIKARLGLEPDRPGIGQNYEMINVVINGKERAFVFLPHGKYIGRWANDTVRKAVANLLEELHICFDVAIDLSRLERRLQTRKELKHVKVPRRSPEEIKRVAAIRNKRYRGALPRPGESPEDQEQRLKMTLKKEAEAHQKARDEKKQQRDGESLEDFEERLKADKKKNAEYQQKSKDKKKQRPDGESQEDFEERLKADKKKHSETQQKSTDKNKQRRDGESLEDFEERLKADKKRIRENDRRFRDKGKERQDGESLEDHKERLRAMVAARRERYPYNKEAQRAYNRRAKEKKKKASAK